MIQFNKPINNLFNIESEFFVIDSNNLHNVHDRLYGFCFANGNCILDINEINGNIANEGAYIYVKNNDDKLIIKQDFTGCYGLYIYKSDDYFALSNSFLYLVDYLKSNNYNLTFNKEYADSFLNKNIETFAYKETIINEITVLERNATIIIDKNKKNMEVSLYNYNENTVEPDTKEFFEILDKWYEKWITIIRNLKQKTNNISVDLTGGFDSRVTFLLFLGANINLDEIHINSINDNLYTHKEDYEIASKMAKHYDFKLNNTKNLLENGIPLSLEDCVNIFAYLKLSFHKEIYVSTKKLINLKYCFGGMGGECIRNYWDYGIEGLIKKESHLGTNIEITNEIKISIKNIINRASKEIVNIYSKFNKDYFDICYYRETSNRTHFGKATLEHFYLNKFCLSPILDSDLHKLKLCNDICKDKNLLIAIIFTRYVDNIIDFNFQGNRIIDSNTIEYARFLNKKYRYNNKVLNKVSKSNEYQKDIDVVSSDNLNNDIEKFLKRKFLTKDTKKVFTSIFDEKIYDSITVDVFNRKYHPLTHAIPVLAITKFLNDCNNKSTKSNYYNYLEELNNELIDVDTIINKNFKIKNSFLENIFSVKNTIDKSHKIITIMGLKIKIKRKVLFINK